MLAPEAVWSGHPAFNLMIAATVMQHDLTLLTESTGYMCNSITYSENDLGGEFFTSGNATPEMYAYIFGRQFTIWAGQRTAVLHTGDTFIIAPGTAHAVSNSRD